MASSNEGNETESCIEFEYEKPPNHQKLTFLTKLTIVLAILILLLIFAFWTVHFALQTESPQKSYYSNIFETATDKELCGIEILPGIVRMSRGVDITTLDIFPEPLADDGFKSVLFSFTCTRNRPWRDPRVKNMLYRVPDQVAAINTMSTGNGDIKTQMYSNLRDIKQSLGAKVGVSGSLFGSLLGSFSAGGSYREARDKILGSAESVAETSVSISAVQMEFESSQILQLSRKFRDALQGLPEKYETAPGKYAHLLDTFGTHYFAKGNFGGVLYRKTIIENNYLYEMSKKEIVTMVEARYRKVAGSVNVDSNHQTTSAEFEDKTRSTFRYFGGHFDTSKENDTSYVHQWKTEVIGDPWLFGGQLEPIESLIQSETLQREVAKAVLVKRIRAAVEDLQRSVSLGSSRLSADELNVFSSTEKYLKNSLGNLTQKEGKLVSLFEKLEEIQDRLLLAKYARQLDSIWSGEFSEAKTNLTNAKCEILPEMKVQLNIINSLAKQFNFLLTKSENPNTPSVEDLVGQVAQLVPTVKKQFRRPNALCGIDTTCRECAERTFGYADNWKEYATFYRNKAYTVRRSLGCKHFLAQNCKSPLEGDLDELYSKSDTLYDQFQEPLNSVFEITKPWDSKRPDKAQMKRWTEETYHLMAKWRQIVSFNICESNLPCQQCVEHNVNCRISNSKWTGLPCDTPDEWKALKYLPVIIESNCTEITLR